jgi:Fe-S-cluster containining protein
MTNTRQQPVRIELRVLGERVAVEVPKPPDRSRLDELLPLFRAIDNAVIDQAVQRAQAAGEVVSCRKGCSACCRAQPVPVTPPEAYALLKLVDSLPEPRRTEIRERFANRVSVLRAAGLLPAYLDTAPTNPNEAREVAHRYFQLGLVCPFLEDDACSIHPDRPFVCRQYLVTSPAELCADPFSNPVRPISIPITPASATLRIRTEAIGSPQFTVPLVLALEFAESHCAELEQTYPAVELARRWIAALSNPV